MEKLRIEYIPIDELTPCDRNPRNNTENVSRVEKSMEHYGWTNPILARKENKQIIAGHTRIEAAKEQGLAEVPVIYLDMDEADALSYMIADNKLTERAEWDEALLADIFKELDTLDFDLELTGFELDEIAIFTEEEQQGHTDEDAVPEEVEAIAKAGDLWQLGEHRLLCGDSTKQKDVERLMGGKKADMVFTDPPWNVNYGDVSKDNKQGYKPRKILNDSMSSEKFRDFMNSVFKQTAQFSHKGAMTYVVMSAQEWGSLMLCLKETGYHWSSTIIWNKDHLVLSRKDYHTKYEPIWYGWLDGEARKCPLEDRKQSDVWDIDRPTVSELHPTTKPVELVERAICNSSKAGWLVLDSFLGSGSTLIACEKSNRVCYGMELDAHYCDVIIKRWEDYTGKKAVRIGDE